MECLTAGVTCVSQGTLPLPGRGGGGGVNFEGFISEDVLRFKHFLTLI